MLNKSFVTAETHRQSQTHTHTHTPGVGFEVLYSQVCSTGLAGGPPVVENVIVRRAVDHVACKVTQGAGGNSQRSVKPRQQEYHGKVMTCECWRPSIGEGEWARHTLTYCTHTHTHTHSNP